MFKEIQENDTFGFSAYYPAAAIRAMCMTAGISPQEPPNGSYFIIHHTSSIAKSQFFKNYDIYAERLWNELNCLKTSGM